MISFLTMQNAIHDWINGETGLETIWEFENGMIPDKPFFSLRLMSFTQIGESLITPSDPQTVAGEQDIITTMDFVLEILGFGTGIVETTTNLKISLNRDDIHRSLVDDGGVITWNDTNSVLDISGIDNDLNEERSSYDVMMRTCDIITDVPFGLIEKVNMIGTLKQTGKPDITQTINVDSTI